MIEMIKKMWAKFTQNLRSPANGVANKLRCKFMKTRKHHNNKGYKQIKTGKTRLYIERLKKKLRKEGILHDKKPSA